MLNDFYACLFKDNPSSEEFSTADFGDEVKEFMGDDFDPSTVTDWMDA